MSSMSTKELCVLVQNLSKEERDNLVFVSSSFPPPFVNVRLRLSLSVCRRKNPRSKICGSGSAVLCESRGCVYKRLSTLVLFLLRCG